MASGLPVITSKTSSLKEIAEEAAILIDPENVQMIVDAIIMLHEKENMCKTLSSKGLQVVKKYNIKNVAEKLLSIYQKLIS